MTAAKHSRHSFTGLASIAHNLFIITRTARGNLKKNILFTTITPHAGLFREVHSTHTTTTFCIYSTQHSLTCWFLWREEKPENPEKNPRGTGENNTSNKLNSHMILPRLEPGTIEVRGQWANHYATHAITCSRSAIFLLSRWYV